MGHEVRWLGNHLGERGTGGVSACHRKTVEAAEDFVFAVPEARDGTGPGDVGLHTISRNLGYGDVSLVDGTASHKTTAGCGLRCGIACPWTVCRRRTGQRAQTASSQASQIEVRYFTQPNQIYLGVDSGGFRTAVPEMIADLFQRKPFRHQVAGTGMAQRVRSAAWSLDSECTQTCADQMVERAL